MSPDSNPVPETDVRDRCAPAARGRSLPPDIDALVERVRGMEPRRAGLLARARARLATGALDSAETLRETARRFLGRHED
jgi:hypothetical protein